MRVLWRLSVLLWMVLLVVLFAFVGASCGTDTIPVPTTAASTGSTAVTPPTSTSTRYWDFSVEVVKGTVVGGVPRFEVSMGDLVQIAVTSDLDDEVHLHVYDMVVAVYAGMPAVFDLEATVPGVFKAELHHAGFRVFELQVS